MKSCVKVNNADKIKNKIVYIYKHNILVRRVYLHEVFNSIWDLDCCD